MGAKYDHGGGPTGLTLAYRQAQAGAKAASKAEIDASEHLAATQIRHDQAFARVKAVRGPGRGKQLRDLSGKPLPKTLYESLDRHQRRLAAAEDRLKAASEKSDTARRVENTLRVHGNDIRTPALVAHDGQPLPTQGILDHMKESGVPDPAFVGHYPNKTAAYRFYRSYKMSRGTLNAERKRTFAAFKSGAYDHSYEGLVGQLA